MSVGKARKEGRDTRGGTGDRAGQEAGAGAGQGTGDGAGQGTGQGTGYAAACASLEAALNSSARADIVDEALGAGSFGDALRRLRSALRAHAFETATRRLDLAPIVRSFDERTQREGFHVLHEWNGKKFLEETIPVLLLDHFARANKVRRPDRACLAILLDYYFLYVLALFVLRAWDEGDPGENLDRVTALLGHLQGPHGSGLRLVERAATLLWVAISHYEPDDHAYPRLLEKARTLGERHRTELARVGASVLGDHLRWGLPVYYEQDLGLMRADNVSDYPWLLFSLVTLARAYARMNEEDVRGPEREDVVEALLNGLTPDTRAFVEKPPPSLEPYPEEHAELRALLRRHHGDLARDFERHRPTRTAYSPLAFQFNFPHNAVMPMVTLALVQGLDPALNHSLDALLTREAPGTPGDTPDGTAGDASPERLARTLMAYAGYSPERRRGRRTLMITYDPAAALLGFNRTMSALKEAAEGAPQQRQRREGGQQPSPL